MKQIQKECNPGEVCGPDEDATAGTTTVSKFFQAQKGGWLRQRCINAMKSYLADKGYVGQIFVIQTGGYPSVNSVIVDITVKLQVPGKTKNSDPHSETTFRFSCYDGDNGLEDPVLQFIIPIQVGSEDSTFFRTPDAEKETTNFEKFWMAHADWMAIMSQKQQLLLKVIKELRNMGCSHISFHNGDYYIISDTADCKIVFGKNEYGFSFHFPNNKVAFSLSDSDRFQEEDYEDVHVIMARIIAKNPTLSETTARGDERLS